MEINTINDIQALAQQANVDWKDYGNVSVKEKDDLLLFNYTAKAQYEGRWNFFERVSRGLITNRKTGEIVARPFDKFFNWGEGDRYTSAKIRTVTEKMDGSLGILYRHNGNYCIATRGSFDSEQAKWATEYLQRNYDLTNFQKQFTLLFEIIYPENRVVVNYGQCKDLILLAARYRDIEDYLPYPILRELAFYHNFTLPAEYQFDDIQYILNIQEKINTNSKGWVVEFTDGQRFKFERNTNIYRADNIDGGSDKSYYECATCSEMLPETRGRDE